MIYLWLASFLVTSLCQMVQAGTYYQTDSHTGTGFLKSFSVQAMSDPTHGRVYVVLLDSSSRKANESLESRYVDASTAASQNLTYASGDHFVLRADYKKTLSSSGPGRDSVRIQSNKRYTTSVMVCVCLLLTSFRRIE